MRTIVCALAIVLGLLFCDQAVLAAHDHNGNLRVVQLAATLAQQAQYVSSQANALIGWGGDWNDQAAARALQQFAGRTAQLYWRARQLEYGRTGRSHDDEAIGHQLTQLFSGTWQQATDVEHYLYASWRLRQIRGYWDYQVCSTLRNLRYALGSSAREIRREANFAALLAR